MNKIKKLLYNCNLIEKEHYIQPFVYVNKYNKSVKHITDKIKWLEETCIKCKKRDLNNKLIYLENNNYSKYKGFINWY